MWTIITNMFTIIIVIHSTSCNIFIFATSAKLVGSSEIRINFEGLYFEFNFYYFLFVCFFVCFYLFIFSLLNSLSRHFLLKLGWNYFDLWCKTKVLYIFKISTYLSSIKSPGFVWEATPVCCAFCLPSKVFRNGILFLSEHPYRTIRMFLRMPNRRAFVSF